jgi:tetratricopeptide (TPR) repeat protein
MASIDRKELLNTQDSFITNTGTIIQWIKNNPMKFISGILIVVVIAGGISGFVYWKTSRENTAISLLSKAGDDSKLIGDVAGKYADTKAGKISKLRLAGIAYDKADFKEAIKNADDFIDSWGAKDMLFYQAMMLRAMSYMEINDYPKAIEALEKCEKGSPEDIKNQAMFYRAVELNASGKKNEAIELLKKLSTEQPKQLGDKKAVIMQPQQASSHYGELAKATLSDISYAAGAGVNAK